MSWQPIASAVDLFAEAAAETGVQA